jgi:hypothetical protein
LPIDINAIATDASSGMAKLELTLTVDIDIEPVAHLIAQDEPANDPRQPRPSALKL